MMILLAAAYAHPEQLVETDWVASHAHDATIRIDTSDFIAIADGSLDGRLALASEKIELEGDLGAAAVLLRLFFPADPDA